MRKPATALLLILLFAVTAIPQIPSERDKPEMTDREARELVGAVETVLSEQSEFSKKPDKRGKFRELPPNQAETLAFDLSGKLVFQFPPLILCGTGVLYEHSKKHSYKYDELGQILENATYSADGEHLYTHHYAYNARGQMTEISYWEPDGQMGFKWLFEFDENGKEVKQTSYGRGGILENIRERKYNEKGLIREEAYYNEGGSLQQKISFAYKYDSQGNWVKRIDSEWTTENGASFFKPRRVTHRTITYHP